MVDKNHRPDNQRYTRWSIRRLSVGVASVVVASGFFILISNPVNAQVGAQNKVVTTTPSNSSTDSGKSILDSKVGQSEKTTADKKETPDATKPSQDLSGRTTQTPDKKVQEKQEVTKENKIGKSIAEAAKKIQKASETVVKEATPKAQEDPSLAQAKQSVADNIKGSTDVPASFLANANHPGPFTAGVNEVIPYELFGGDGMLTRLLLKSSDGAPWSDNGTAKHAGLLPFANIPKGKYFYQVSLNGNAAGKQGKALLDQLKANGTHTYTATVKVYGATKDGKADLNNVIATRQVKLNLNGTTTVEQIKKSVSENIKEKIDVPASYLKNAVFPGPFTAGVNQVIPYELFGGDGMLTRLLLKSSNGAPWSDNGSAKHPGLLPLAGLGKGQYFYQVSLNGNAAGKQGKALLDQLKANGTHTYTATVKVYGATKDAKADLNNVIATRQVNLNLNGTTTVDQVKKSVVDNIKDKIDVPASYLKNAVFPGPFTAGVNQVIPYELFGGDGMLTRLLLKSSDGASWSDNGKANHAGLLPLAGLEKGQYFYQVSLDGNAAGKQDKALLDQLKANGTHSYKATVTVYGATKDGKADLKNVIATKSVTINLKGEKKADSKGQSQQGQNDQVQNQGKKADHDGSKHSNKGGTPSATTSKGGQATASKKSLPNTGQKSSLGLTVLGLLGLSAAAILALVGMKRREKK